MNRYFLCGPGEYCASYYCVSIVLKTLPIGVAYATECGVGIMLMAVVGYFFFKQQLDSPALIGLALIASGVVVINAFSNSAAH